MKFGKEFKKEKVPEWTEAYMDYNGLKQILRNMRAYRQNNHPAMNRTLSGFYRQSSRRYNEEDLENQAIEIKTLQRDGSRQLFETVFIEQTEGGVEFEVTFFRKLDEELNKANNFYKDKVKGMMDEANQLNKQMESLIALRIRVEKRSFKGSNSNSHYQQEQSQSSGSEEKVKVADQNHDPVEALEHVKINNTPQSPVSTIKDVLRDSKVEDLSYGKGNLRRAEQQLRVAFIEFYHKLYLLKQYSYMNLLAFSKIMKKYEKITSRKASKLYMEVVDNSDLGDSDEIIDLMERVEATFIKNFSKSNRSEGMKSLRPKQRRENHIVTFFSGFFSGCTIALLVAIALKIELHNLATEEEGVQYLQSIFPLYSVFLYAVLHLLMYAANIYFWRRYRINYPFIFGFKRGTELEYRDVFLLSTGLAVLASSGFLANLRLDMDSNTQKLKKVTQLVPLGLVTLVLLLIFCPLNILYRTSRVFFIQCLFRCILAPLYPVTFPDFFLADQLTSQMQALRSCVLYICYYGLGKYLRRQEKCHTHGLYNTLYFVIAVIPYWLRFLQCLRRLIEGRDKMNGYNALTYLSTIIAVVFRTIYELRKESVTWMVFALISSAVATLVNIYWDIVFDWGLLRRHSKNFYLRDKLIVSLKIVYVVAMVLDILLRAAWMQLVLAFNLHSAHKMGITTTVFSLEIIRRDWRTST
ncbi:phosphate transporter PHO1 homolog 10 isoform X2 [Humulus lupulus]|uniref:phosphate transporter PHO1 homolog 10 isoform X2 n=1 Tax=Humulus lupulus TaxID=3486 RepID=UPI002B402B6D|nr:phosphate transporter PHO1 homolog 10 isoform X2 [Humulus lupulus]